MIVLLFSAIFSQAALLPTFQAIDYFTSFEVDGCYERSTMISLELKAIGIPSGRISAYAPEHLRILSPSGDTDWNFHTATLVIKDKEFGRWVDPDQVNVSALNENLHDYYVLDPLFGRRLLNKEEWLSSLRIDHRFQVEYEKASLTFHDFIAESCSNLMRYSFFGPHPMEKIKELRSKIHARTLSLIDQIGVDFEARYHSCYQDKYEPLPLDQIAKKGWTLGAEYRLSAKLKPQCVVQLGRGSSVIDQQGHLISENLTAFRYQQATQQPDCFSYQGTMQVEKIQYLFSGLYTGFFQVQASGDLAGQTTQMEFLVNSDGGIEMGRFGFDSKIYTTMGVNEIRMGRTFPPFFAEYYYGSNSYLDHGDRPFWTAGFYSDKGQEVWETVIYPAIK